MSRLGSDVVPHNACKASQRDAAPTDFDDIDVVVDDWNRHLQATNRAPSTIQSYVAVGERFARFLRDQGGGWPRSSGTSWGCGREHPPETVPLPPGDPLYGSPTASNRGAGGGERCEDSQADRTTDLAGGVEPRGRFVSGRLRLRSFSFSHRSRRWRTIPRSPTGRRC
jgi:hypothetical protein